MFLPMPNALPILLAAALSGCAAPATDQRQATPAPELTETEAMAIVRGEIRNTGRDPALSELSARPAEGQWHVTAWHIRYPENKGATRFVPGGFTSYTIGASGEILTKRPGH